MITLISSVCVLFSLPSCVPEGAGKAPDGVLDSLTYLGKLGDIIA